MEPRFLTLGQVLDFHQQQIDLFGGDPGERDQGLLESALTQPPTAWIYDSETDVFDLAAGYAFHLTKNHPFIDGNKRVALHASLAFLQINEIEVIASEEAMYDATIALTTSAWTKNQFAAFLRANTLAT